MASHAHTIRLAAPVSEDDHSSGPENAPVTLVECADFECPYCGMAERGIRAVRQELGDRLRFVFREFPLIESHPHALQAAAAAEAAALQGEFWEMHALLFRNQRALDVGSLLRYAREIGLDLERFTSDMESDAVLARVHRDLESGERSGVDGTPSFFINGEKLEGSWEYDNLLPALEAAAGM